MFVTSIVTKIIGSSNQRTVRKLSKIVKTINGLESQVQTLKDEDFKAKTEEFKKRVAQGETLENLLPEVFAVAREAAYRVNKEKPYYVQILGGLAIHYGNIAEMRTGEGKTLT